MINNSTRSVTIAKNTLYMFFRMLLVAIVSFYTSRVVLRVLGVEDFGIYNIVGSLVVFLSFFKNALTNATYRFLTYEIGKENYTQLKRLFSMSLNVHIILSIVLFLLLEIVGVWFLNNRLNIPSERITAANWVFQLSLLTFCIEVIKTPYNSMIIANERMSFFSYTGIIEVLLKLIVVFILQLCEYDKLILYSLLLTVVSIIMFLWYKRYCNKHFVETQYSHYWDVKLLKELVTYSGWSVVVNAADVTVSQCINIFLNLFYGVITNAAMGIANQVNALLNQFLSTFSTSYNPQIIKSYASGDRAYFMKLLYSTSKISFFLLFAVSFPLIFNIEYLLKIWLINPPELAGVFLVCVICYSLFDSFSAPLWNAVHATGYLKVHQLLMSSIKLLNIPLGYYLLKQGLPSYSILILYATLNGICSIVRIIYLHWLINLDVIDFFKRVILKLAAVVFLSVLFPMLTIRFDMTPFIKLVSSSLLFLFSYMFLVYFIGLDNSERGLCVNFIKRKFVK